MEMSSPYKLQINSRRMRVLDQMVSGKNQTEIAITEGVNRKTIYRDLQNLKTPIDIELYNTEDILNQIYRKLGENTEEILQRARASTKDSEAAKLYAVAMEYEKLILDYFKPESTSREVEVAEMRMLACP